MKLSKVRVGVLITGVVATCAIAIFSHLRDSSVAVTAQPHDAARSSVSHVTPTEFAGASQSVSAVATAQVGTNWAKEYNATSDYFNFVVRAARNALDGDGSAALYISKALYLCLPIARQYARSINPETDFNAYWAGMTKAPQWVVDKARKDFQSCNGFIKGDAFAGLPERPGGYSSSGYWMEQAAKDQDPVALSLQAGSDISKASSENSGDVKTKSLESAQVAINNAIASKNPAALFQVGQLLSDGHASSDPLQGFAVSIAACNLGYDCTANNAELFHDCAVQGACPQGINYSDVIKKVVGVAGYAQAYARAQQLEDAMARGDTSAVQKFVQLKPGE
jgi:hypothetical protein